MAHSKTKEINIPKGGRIDSSSLNSFVKNVVLDISNIFNTLTKHSNKTDTLEVHQKTDTVVLHNKINDLQKQIDALNLLHSRSGDQVFFTVSVSDSNKLDYVPNSLVGNRLIYNRLFGEITLPVNNAISRFYHTAIESLRPIVIEDLNINITGVFNAEDGAGVIDHEYDGTVTTIGEPINAFNGSISNGWLKKVEFEEYSDVTEVMNEITIDLPEGSSSDSNVIYVIPHQNSSIDIVGVYTSPDLDNNFVLIDNFEEIKATSAKRFIFPVRQIQRVKIRFRQKDFTYSGNKKVFYIGAQEIGLSLLDWDKSYVEGNDPSANNSIVLKQKAPKGYKFKTIKSFYASPDFLLEDTGLRHVHVKISSDLEGTDVIWDSDSDLVPQDTVNGYSFDVAAEYVYFIVTMNYVDSSGGASSPFEVSTSPTLTEITFAAEVEEA